MRIWDAYLTDEERATFADSGWGRRGGFGERPVVVVVDVNYAFAGDRPEPVARSIERWPYSCGEAGWRAAEHIRTLLDAAHARGIPVIFSTGQDSGPSGFGAGRWADKNAEGKYLTPEQRQAGNTILPPIAPGRSDIVIRKSKPSVFFGSILAAYLVDLQADSLIVCGGVTSGCVRATVVDSFSYNYRTIVVEEGTFDRGRASHAINLFDMQQKYADVLSLADVLDYLQTLPEGLFDARMPILRARAAAPAVAGGSGED